MKAFFVAFLALAVSASALPQEFEIENWQQRNVVERRIREMIEGLSQTMKDNGLDPVEVRRWAMETSPQPGVDVRIWVEDLRLTGASWFDIRRLEWSTVRSRLRMNVVLPEIFFSLGESGLEVSFQGEKYVSEISGEFKLTGLTIICDATMNVGPITGISVRTLELGLRFTDMRANTKVVINENDYSAQVNRFFNNTVPTWLLANQRAIDQWISDTMKRIINDMLG